MLNLQPQFQVKRIGVRTMLAVGGKAGKGRNVSIL
jgi:hypothetical protein